MFTVMETKQLVAVQCEGGMGHAGWKKIPLSTKLWEIGFDYQLR